MSHGTGEMVAQWDRTVGQIQLRNGQDNVINTTLSKGGMSHIRVFDGKLGQQLSRSEAG